MTPPASTEPVYLISESAIRVMEERVYVRDGQLCNHRKRMEICKSVRARGPVAQQAPTAPPEICCKCEDTPDVCGSTQRKCEDAALIAQEREKWEKERAALITATLPCDQCPDKNILSCSPELIQGIKNHHAAIVAQAREGVLKELIEHYEKVIDGGSGVTYNHPITYEWMYRGVVVDYLKSLRSEVGKK